MAYHLICDDLFPRPGEEHPPFLVLPQRDVPRRNLRVQQVAAFVVVYLQHGHPHIRQTPYQMKGIDSISSLI